MAFDWSPSRKSLNEVITHHRSFMESYLGVPESDWTFHFKNADICASLIPHSLFKKVSKATGFIANKIEEKVSGDISNVVFAPDSRWGYSLTAVSKGRDTKSVDLCWSDATGAVGFEIPKAGLKLVFLRHEYFGGPGAESPSSEIYIITAASDSLKMREYLKDALNSDKTGSYTIWTYDTDNNGTSIASSSTGVSQNWDNLVLEESVVRLVRKDIESFFSRKDWFIKNHIPFRRGYLLHGPPGNGKTSVVKTMLSTLGMNAYKIRLFSPKVTDDTLEAMFRLAQKSGPNMVILEDLDRAFPKTGERRSTLGMHTLLNCLDGMESQEGVITIATANEPTALDKAILKRPGRFDRVILFDNPSRELRRDFFLNKAPYLLGEDLSAAVDATEGFSFAQLQETYVLAGQYAYERSSKKIISSDLHVCAAELRGATNSVSGEKLGYLK